VSFQFTDYYLPITAKKLPTPYSPITPLPSLKVNFNFFCSLIMEAIKHELKKIGSLALFFFLGFGYILLIMKLFLEEYSITTYVLGKAILGAIIAAKTVAILDATLKLQWLQNRPRYLSILYRTFIYTVAAMILGLIEGFIEADRGTRTISDAIAKFLQTETFSHILAVTLCLAVVFFLHNIWQEIDRSLGKAALSKFFLSTPENKINRLGSK
jgi:hypothetical protein